VKPQKYRYHESADSSKYYLIICNFSNYIIRCCSKNKSITSDDTGKCVRFLITKAMAKHKRLTDGNTVFIKESRQVQQDVQH
jgi:hypothetical protein